MCVMCVWGVSYYSTAIVYICSISEQVCTYANPLCFHFGSVIGVCVCVGSKNCRRWRWTQKTSQFTRNYLDFITCLCGLYVRPVPFRFEFLSLTAIVVCATRSYIYKICKFRRNCAGAVNALTLEQ